MAFKTVKIEPGFFKKAAFLKAGQELFLTGIIYTARDQAHKRLTELLAADKKLPIDLKTSVIYYCGPNPANKNFPIGACGPTTAGRMDAYTPQLLKAGLKVMIGKGSRSLQVKKAIVETGSVYLTAPAGCGALLATKIKSASIMAFKDLNAEAIYKLEVKDFPVVVAIDSEGKDIFEKVS